MVEINCSTTTPKCVRSSSWMRVLISTTLLPSGAADELAYARGATELAYEDNTGVVSRLSPKSYTRPFLGPPAASTLASGSNNRASTLADIVIRPLLLMSPIK
ncbi:hypothetical protein Taro_007203 [Colocasia esculenta]|uniref:Uncharacterized protein n=1 Tax=Colocasia esculenta TaxID=4460 RepID=A0A843TUT4_COLES|nr:hypothetical protein [Colocasia esculenta]